MSDRNKAVVKKMLEMIWNEGKVAEAIAEYRAPTCVSRGLAADPYREQTEYEGFIGLVQSVLTDTRFAIDEMVAEGDLVACRASLTGKTRKGAKPVSLHGFGLTKVKDGRIVEAWNGWDALGFRAQLRGEGPGSLEDVLRAEA
jgi:predicted SnoaL-like aldol condensation-catalyzing enzyme